VELCQSEGLPSSLQPLLVAVEDTVELGHLSAGDLAQWAREQRRDMGRLGKHLREVRGTVQPLTDRLTAAEKEEKTMIFGSAFSAVKPLTLNNKDVVLRLNQRAC
jgi:hypothetical protein